jgi:LSM domain
MADMFFVAAEDNLNISLKDITVTGRDGRVSQLDQVYIRGSMVRFFIVPDMLQNAPMYVVPSFRSMPIFSLERVSLGLSELAPMLCGVGVLELLVDVPQL